jgi:tRNA dimethylallyltransferase
MSIGTAKPTETELAQVPHHFINSHSVIEPVHAASYGAEARELLSRMRFKFNVIILAGGSGLYIDAVTRGMDDLPEADLQLRWTLEREWEEPGPEALQERLQKLDPVTWSRIDLNNPRRLIRALEIIQRTGQPLSRQIGERDELSGFRIRYIMPDWPREELYQRINFRTREMFEQGLVNEVKGLLSSRNLHALHTVGYREVFEYLDGLRTLEETIDLVAKNTRNYAKRQLTWFRKYENLVTVPPHQLSTFASVLKESLNL